jgi:PAH dioxygenase large subunit
METVIHPLPSDVASDRMQTLLRDGQRALQESGMYPARMFNDPDVFALERERVFGRTWVYLGHESELPNRGDYVIRYIVDDEFILTKDKDGSIRALQNGCRHRGMQLCRSDRGNAAAFTCPYHGWTYATTGELIGVPMGDTLLPPQFERHDWALRKIPKLGTFCGMIFGSLDPSAPPLDEYLAGVKWYLEMMAGRTKNGLEVLGSPQRWVVDADWKLGADNFVGDAYHTQMTHRSMLGGAKPRDAKFAMLGEHIHAGNGHGLGIGRGPEGADIPPYVGLPPELWPEYEQTLRPEQAAILKRTLFIDGTVFPNMSFLQVLEAKDERSMPTAMLTFRTWHPLAAGKMEIWSWCLVDRDAPAEHKDESYRAYLRTFGSSGGFEQDDTENWRSITRAARGQFAKQAMYNYQLGRTLLHRDPDWRGPGDAFPLAFAELNQIAFHQRWLRYMIDAPDAVNQEAVRP